jgi:hypothetical protein
MKQRMFSQSYRLQSFTGEQLKWKVKRLGSRLELVNTESRKVIGKMSGLSFGIRKPGILEFNIDGGQRLFEEVLVSALAVVEARRRACLAANANEDRLALTV